MTEVLLTQISLGILLMATLFIGLRAGRSVKTMQDYALANQELSLGIITITFLATFIGMNSLGMVCLGYSYGIGHLIQLPFWLLGAFLLGWFVLPKLVYFKGSYTLGGVVRQLYGERVAWMVSCLTVLYCLLFMAIQVVYMGDISASSWTCQKRG